MEKELNLTEWVARFIEVLTQNNKPSEWLEIERLNGNLKLFFPELFYCYGVEQNKYHKYDVYYHTLYTCDAIDKRLDLRLSALFHDIGKTTTKVGKDQDSTFYNHEIISTEIAYKVLNLWNIDQKIIKKVTLLVRYHMFHYVDKWSDKAMRRILRKVGRENLEDLFLLRVADREGNGLRKGEPMKIKEFRLRLNKLIEKDKEFKIKDLAVNGDNLIALGIKPGPIIGKILKHLFTQVKEKKIKNKQYDLMQEITSMMDEKKKVFKDKDLKQA